MRILTTRPAPGSASAAGALAVCLATILVLQAPALMGQTAVSKMTTVLGDLARAVPQNAGGLAFGTPIDLAAMPRSVQDAASTRQLRLSATNTLQVYILMTEVTDANVRRLTSAGVSVELMDVAGRRVQARVPVRSLQRIAALPFVSFIRLPSYARRHAGSVVTEGDAIHASRCRAGAVRRRWNRRQSWRDFRRDQRRLRVEVSVLSRRVRRPHRFGQPARIGRHAPQRRARGVAGRHCRGVVSIRRGPRGHPFVLSAMCVSRRRRRRHRAARDRPRPGAGRRAVVRQRRHRASSFNAGGERPRGGQRRRRRRPRVSSASRPTAELGVARTPRRRSTIRATDPRVRHVGRQRRQTTTTSARTSTRAWTADRSPGSPTPGRLHLFQRTARDDRRPRTRAISRTT